MSTSSSNVTQQNSTEETGVRSAKSTKSTKSGGSPAQGTIKSKRPFEDAIQVYQEILDDAVLKAIEQLSRDGDKTRYAPVRLGLFKDEIEIGDRIYKLHKLHYGPINNAAAKTIQFEEGSSPDFIRAYTFCLRDNSIWQKVNGKGKNPGGDGLGFGNTACSPFRDTQCRLRDEGYYLLDLSQYLYDEDREKWYYKIDIRLYQSRDNLEPNPDLWHRYGMIPGLGALTCEYENDGQATRTAIRTAVRGTRTASQTTRTEGV